MNSQYSISSGVLHWPNLFLEVRNSTYSSRLSFAVKTSCRLVVVSSPCWTQSGIYCFQ